jgi:hypothetical protein
VKGSQTTGVRAKAKSVSLRHAITWTLNITRVTPDATLAELASEKPRIAIAVACTMAAVAAACRSSGWRSVACSPATAQTAAVSATNNAHVHVLSCLARPGSSSGDVGAGTNETIGGETVGAANGLFGGSICAAPTANFNCFKPLRVSDESVQHKINHIRKRDKKERETLRQTL